MSKYVVFSFDDGRLDTYTNAYKVLNEYSMPATLNVATDFINNAENYKNFLSAGNKAMSWEEIYECRNSGWEIACHGHMHLNDSADINECISQLKNHGINEEKIGFASPNSEINDDNYNIIAKSDCAKDLLYIRSGLQRRREGILYAGLSFLNSHIKSKKLFCILNKRCKLKINQDMSQKYILSVGISSEVTLESVTALLKSLNDGEGIILMFHSILSDKESNQKLDSWWWDINKLKRLCEWISQNSDIKVLTTKQLVEHSLNK